MAFTYRIDPHRGLALVTLQDFVTRRDLFEARRQVLDDPGWQPGFSCVWDGRAVATFVLTIDDLIDFADLARRAAGRSGAGRTAMVVSRELLFQVMGLLTGLLHDARRPARTFKSMACAAEWLDLDRPFARTAMHPLQSIAA